jgi:hypothetical protein
MHQYDAGGMIIEPHLPMRRRRGQPRKTDLRAVVDAIFYIARRGANGGCCRRNFHRLPRCKGTSTSGATRPVGNDQPRGADGRP